MKPYTQQLDLGSDTFCTNSWIEVILNTSVCCRGRRYKEIKVGCLAIKLSKWRFFSLTNVAENEKNGRITNHLVDVL